MLISKVIMIIMAVFFTLGALDRLIGNKFGLGGEFERAFGLMGPTALSIIGLIAFAPIIASGLTAVLAPLFNLIGADACMFPGMLMSSEISYPIANEMTSNHEIALFGGLVVGAVMGAPISFSIPLACGLIDKKDYRYFATGILSGYILDPVACFIGGLVMGLPAMTILINLVPVIIVALILAVGLYFKPDLCIKLFKGFSKLLMAVITVGLFLGAIKAMTGFEIVKGMNPVSDGFKTLGTITLTIGGSLPLLFLLRKVLNKILLKLSNVLKVNDVTTLSMVIGLTSIVPGYSSFKEMNGRGKIMFAALTASACPMLGCHLGVTAATDTAIIVPMLVAKCCGGIFAIIVAAFFSKRLYQAEELN